MCFLLSVSVMVKVKSNKNNQESSVVFIFFVCMCNLRTILRFRLVCMSSETPLSSSLSSSSFSLSSTQSRNILYTGYAPFFSEITFYARAWGITPGLFA